MTSLTQTSSNAELTAQIASGTVGRLVLNTARRFAYPFAPALSRGLGVPVSAITSLIAINQVSGVMSPLFGPLSDRLGYRFAMLLGVGMVAAGMLASGLFPIYALIAVALFCAGVGRSVYDPALQAFVGQRVPYAYRGRVIGFVEMSWSGSSLIGIPLIGLLIERAGWRAPFVALGLVCLGLMVLLWALMPAARGPETSGSVFADLRTRWHLLFRKRSAASALFYSFTANAANDVFFVVYGLWLEQTFDLSVLAVGVTTIVIGLAELSGEGLTVLISDRLGLKRALLSSLVLTMLAYALFPLAAQTLTTALVALFLLFLIFEYNIVTAISLFTEVLPKARATMMSGYKAAAGTGRMTGALLGVPVWTLAGMAGIGAAAAALSALGLLALLWGLRGWEEERR